MENRILLTRVNLSLTLLNSPRLKFNLDLNHKWLVKLTFYCLLSENNIFEIVGFCEINISLFLRGLDSLKGTKALAPNPVNKLS